MQAPRSVGVVGAGTMGAGIAQLAAASGITTILHDPFPEALERGVSRIEAAWERRPVEGASDRLSPAGALEDLADCDLVIEAAIENIDAKHEVFKALDAVCAPGAIFASNTSSLSITEMAAKTKRPARFVGLHFFNPVPLMQLVEVVKTPMTDDAVLAEVDAFAKKLPKVVVTAQDTPGFVVNRLLVPFLLDAIRVLESGVASREDIDNGMKLGCGHPMGPLTLLDFVGLDTTYYIANIMFDEFKEPRFAPPPLLKRMVLAGWHGKKSGRGFYDYSAGAAK